VKQYSWSDITVEQYLDIQEIVSQKDITPTDFIIGVGEVLFDVGEDITTKELKEIKEAIAFVGKPIVGKLNTTEVKNFKRLTLADFIELDVMLVTNNFVDSVAKVGSILFDCDVMDRNIIPIYKAVEEFIKYRQNTYKSFPNLFDSDDDEDVSEEEGDEEESQPPNPAQSWLNSVFGLTKGDITKYNEVMQMPHLLVFNWASLTESLSNKKKDTTNQ